jgi:hypothetical protein
MANCEDPSMHHMELPTLDPSVDSARIDPHLDQLRPRNDPMLPSREPRDAFVRGTFASHTEAN